jgi:hypothetical protein
MHELFVALSLSILTFMPCVVTMDGENECEPDTEETA